MLPDNAEPKVSLENTNPREILIYSDFQYKDENPESGWFHGFSSEGDSEDGIGPLVIVEYGDGRVAALYPTQIRFKYPPGSLPTLIME